MASASRLKDATVTAVQYLLLLGGELSWIYPWTLALEMWIGQKRELLSLPVVAGLLAAATFATRLAARVPTGLPARNPGSAGILPAGGPKARETSSYGFRPALKRLAALGPRTLLRVALYHLVRGSVVALGLVVAVRLGLQELPTFIDGDSWSGIWSQLISSDFGNRAFQAWLLAGAVWWRGMKLGARRLSLTTVEDAFTTGIVAMACLLVLAALAGKAAPVQGDSLLLSTLAFLFTCLVGMPLARVVDVGRHPRHQGGPGLSPGGWWLGALLAIVLGLLLWTLLLAQLLNFDRILAFWDIVSPPLGAALSTAVYILALPVGLLVQALIFLARLLIRPSPPKQRPAQNDADWLDKLQQGQVPPLAPELILAMKVVFVLAVAGVLVWLLVRVISSLGDRWQPDGVEESHDSVWSWPGFGGLWRWLMARWRPIQRRVSALAGPRHPTVAAQLTVREVYRQFLTLGAGLGRPRRPSETPLEYERRLASDPALPGEVEVRSLTDGYSRARYAAPSPAPADPGPLASALARLRSLWKAEGPNHGGTETLRH